MQFLLKARIFVINVQERVQWNARAVRETICDQPFSLETGKTEEPS